MDFYVRNYQEQDWDSAVRLYKKLIKCEENVIYWWPGPENTWEDVHCVFHNGAMIAKGQVEVINMVSKDYLGDANHLIYVNIKVDPDWESFEAVMDILYDRLLQRAKLLKNKLPSKFPTKLCVGNYATEIIDNSYFESKGFKHFESLYWMSMEKYKDLSPINFKLTNVNIKHWDMNTHEEEIKYLQVENTIWPENPTGLGKLHEYKRNPYWTSITAFYNDEIIGSVMAWKEQDQNIGIIENVFVKPDWRGHGLAKHLIIEGIRHLQKCDLDYIELLVETKNESALKLYQSIGFKIKKEEKRFWINI
ncbi:GNAT family N-acetyltransferase [Bacillus ndiopicus]|uniref:GNAT family N-acetyltransferase n=1 Tax=Bacillus ndiopicus TaxID=1347368 RepID=UPI0005A6169F|nr:GNAT family N-acetyltransferase [Bacillus ndiopicus]